MDNHKKQNEGIITSSVDDERVANNKEHKIVSEEERDFIDNLWKENDAVDSSIEVDTNQTNTERVELKGLSEEQKAELILKNPEKYGVDTSSLSESIGKSALSILGTVTGTRVFYEAGKLVVDLKRKKEQRTELTSEVFSLLEEARIKDKKKLKTDDVKLSDILGTEATEEEKEAFSSIDLEGVELNERTSNILNKFKSINIKLREVKMPPEEKMALRSEMASILREYRKRERDLSEVKEEKMKNLTDLYINNKAQAMLVGKEAFNTAAFVATSPLGGVVMPMLRTMGFMAFSTAERVRNAIEKYNRLHFRKNDANLPGKVKEALKSTFIDSVKETLTGLTWQGKDKNKFQKSTAFISSLASILRVSGIAGIDIFSNYLKSDKDGVLNFIDKNNISRDKSMGVFSKNVDDSLGLMRRAGLGDNLGSSADNTSELSGLTTKDGMPVESLGLKGSAVDFLDSKYNQDIKDEESALQNTTDNAPENIPLVESDTEALGDIYKVKSGDTLWSIIGKMKELDGLEEGRRDNAISNILEALKKNEIALKEFGIEDGDINNLTSGQKLNLDVIRSILGQEKIDGKGIVEHAESLSEEAVSTIKENNDKIANFYSEIKALKQDDPTIKIPQLDEEMAERIIKGEVDVDSFRSESVGSGLDANTKTNVENYIKETADKAYSKKIEDIYKVTFLGIPIGNQIEEWTGNPEKGIVGIKDMPASDVFEGNFESFSGKSLDAAELKNREELLKYLKELEESSGLKPGSETTEEYIRKAETALLRSKVLGGGSVEVRDGIEIKVPPEIRIKG